MSGIVGILNRDGRPIDRADLEQMVDILAHRGPDGAQAWYKGHVGLGHRMLQTTPESLQEQLPMVSTSGELVITADARIDNRDELIPLLGLQDRPSLEVADSQVILAAYDKWGEACPEKLLGDFAFAIWDNRRKAIFCARDHFGIKPFYYYAGDRVFAFASESRALVCLPQIPRDLNEVWIAEYLAGMFEDMQVTSYQHIYRLPPAHSLTIDCQSLTKRCYWALDPTFELHLKSDEAYAEAFRNIFTEAVRCRLRSHTPAGSMLSGGLDSSSIVCTAGRLLSQSGGSQLHTFSAMYDDVPECDERPFIEAVLAQGYAIPHFLRGDQVNPFGDIEQIIWHQDGAYNAPNMAVHWKLLELAKKQGIRVLFDGFDGDSTVSYGFEYMHELAANNHWIALTRHLPRVAAAYDESALGLFWQFLWCYRFGPTIYNRRLFQASRYAYWRVSRKLGFGKNPASAWARWTAFLNPELVKRTNLYERYRSQQQASQKEVLTQREVHFRTLSSGLQPLAAEMLDKAAAAFGIEMRYPFRDKRLVEFCLAVPSEQKLSQGWSRMILRRGMGGVLPEAVQWRLTKTDFLPNFRRGLSSFGREFVGQTIDRPLDGIDSYANVAAVRAAYAQFVSDTSSQKGLELFALLRVVLLAQWAK